MNLIVHIQKGVRKQGYEMATRQAWRCGIKANLVKRVVGVVKGQIVCVWWKASERNCRHHSTIRFTPMSVRGVIFSLVVFVGNPTT